MQLSCFSNGSARITLAKFLKCFVVTDGNQVGLVGRPGHVVALTFQLYKPRWCLYAIEIVPDQYFDLPLIDEWLEYSYSNTLLILTIHNCSFSILTKKWETNYACEVMRRTTLSGNCFSLASYLNFSSIIYIARCL